jgi:hypothetical protein
VKGWSFVTPVSVRGREGNRKTPGQGGFDFKEEPKAPQLHGGQLAGPDKNFLQHELTAKIRTFAPRRTAQITRLRRDH